MGGGGGGTKRETGIEKEREEETRGEMWGKRDRERQRGGHGGDFGDGAEGHDTDRD